MTSEFEILTGNQKRKVLAFNNFLYRKTRNYKNIQYWRCRRGCSVYLTIDKDSLLSVGAVNDHTHESEIWEINMLKFKMSLRKAVIESPHSLPQSLYRKVLAEFSVNDRLRMPQYSAVRSSMYEYRKQVLPKIPKLRSSVKIEGDWALTCDKEQFLMYNDGEADKILIFGTERSLYLLHDLEPRFDREIWNHYNTEVHRTTNSLESWHSRINSDINRSHPNLWCFLDVLKSDQQYTSVKIELALADELLVTTPRRSVRERQIQYDRYKLEFETGHTDLNIFMSKISRFCPSSIKSASPSLNQ